MRKLKRWHIGVAGLVVLLALVGVWWYRRQHSLTVYARRLSACIRRADGGCVLDSMTKEERAAYGMDAQQMTRFLREYVLPTVRFRGGKPSCDGTDRAQTVLCGMAADTRLGDMPLHFSVSQTDDGIKAPQLMMAFIAYTGAVKYLPASGPLTAAGKIEAWTRQAVNDRAQLEELGLKGVKQSADEPFRSWDEYLEFQRVRLSFSRAGEEAHRQGLPNPSMPPRLILRR